MGRAEQRGFLGVTDNQQDDDSIPAQKTQKVFANLDLIYCEPLTQNKCFDVSFSFEPFRSYVS
jgi:hypothetical protein